MDRFSPFYENEYRYHFVHHQGPKPTSQKPQTRGEPLSNMHVSYCSQAFRANRNTILRRIIAAASK